MKTRIYRLLTDKIARMKKLHDLEAFTKMLIDKGYNGFFHTEGAYAGKLKDSINEYLENWRQGVEDLSKPELVLTTYLHWAGEDKPSVQCRMWISHHNQRFDLGKLEILKKDQFGRLLRRTELTKLSASSVPQAKEAIAMVNDEQKQRTVPRNKPYRL